MQKLVFDGGSEAIAAADLDGSGKASLLLGDGTALQVLKIGADGGLALSQTLAQTSGSGAFAQAIAVDLNGDHKLDVVADEIFPDAGNALDIILQGASGWLPVQREGGDIASPSPIDLAGNGGVDLVGIDAAGLQPLINDGAGHFTRPAATALAPDANQLATADFNGDGKGDVAAVAYSPDEVFIFLGNGDGSFKAGTTLNVGPMALAVVSADFNGDGKPDLAVMNGGDSNFQNASVAVYFGEGNGTFNQPVKYPIAQGWADLVVGDFDGNGTPDLAAVISEGAIGLFLNDGRGNFTAEPAYPVGTALFGIAAGDFDGNGTDDIAAIDAPHHSLNSIFNMCH